MAEEDGRSNGVAASEGNQVPADIQLQEEDGRSNGVAASEGYSMPSSDLSGLIGKHVMYTYNNGWQYEVFYKNKETVDYRVVSGLVGGRWVKGQKVDMRQLAKGEERYMVNWTEPTGTCVSKVVDMEKREVNTVIFFPRWVADVPKKTVCFQNDHLDLMRSYRDAGPTYPIHVVNAYGRMYYIEDCDPDDDHVIS